MGVQILDNFDIGQAKTLDSRMVWTGTIANLNNIPNKYEGLIVYATTDDNLYVFQGSTWEKIVTNNVDSRIASISGGTFQITPEDHGQVIYINNPTSVIASWSTTASNYPVGFNVTLVQEGLGNVTINNGPDFTVNNRLNFKITAGRWAVASILRIRNTSTFLLYGDVV